MTDHVPGGHFLISRMIYLSAIWKKPPQYLRLFLWFIGKAVYQDGHVFKGHVLKRGELVTTYGEIAGALSYCFNRAIVTPSVKEIRIMLFWLQSEGMILMKPLIDGTSPNKGRPIELTRAYVGMLIIVVNYDTYQDIESYKGRDKGRPSSELGQTREYREKEINLFRENALQILTYLNEKTGKKYRDTSFIEARLKDGGSVDDCRKIINTKMHDPYFLENPKYLNPQTLFRKSHWDSYLNESIPAAETKNTPPSISAIPCPSCGRTVLSTDMVGEVCVLCVEVQTHA